MRGLNLAANWDVTTPSDNGSVWRSMWRIWDWDSWIKPQIDDIAAIGNTVRHIGTMSVFGDINLSTYLTRWDQFLDYCTSKNLMIYPCGSCWQPQHWNISNEVALYVYGEWSKLLAKYASQCIGIDVVNEMSGDATGVFGSSNDTDGVAFLNELAMTVRRNAGLPVTISQTASNGTELLGNDYARGQARYQTLSDFVDMHCYFSTAGNPLPYDAFTLIARHEKALLIGEFGGLSLANTPAQRTTGIAEVAAAIATDPMCVGGLYWCAWDLSGAANPVNKQGMYDRNRALRTDVSNTFTTLPLTR